MEKERKSLKEMSVAVLAFAALSLVRMVVEFIFGRELITDAAAGMTEAFLNTAFIVIFALGIIFLIPQVYVGMKGLQASKGAVCSKAYIGWAKALFVLSILAVAASVYNMVGNAVKATDIIAIVDAVLDAIIFFLFIKCAKAVAAQ